MGAKSAVKQSQKQTAAFRRAVVTHLVRQSGGPTADPRDALRLARCHYGLVPRSAAVGRFTARICRLGTGEWALDFNPEHSKIDLVCAIWHELAELLCLNGDVTLLDDFCYESYQESAVSDYDQRHLCAVGVERFVRYKLGQLPVVRSVLLADKIRQILLVRGLTASVEPLLPAIEREPWYEDESDAGGSLSV